MNYTYLFSFGDRLSPVQNFNGSIVHSYSMPGSYQASVTIQGFSVNIHFETLVIVQGT